MHIERLHDMRSMPREDERHDIPLFAEMEELPGEM